MPLSVLSATDEPAAPLRWCSTARATPGGAVCKVARWRGAAIRGVSGARGGSGRGSAHPLRPDVGGGVRRPRRRPCPSREAIAASMAKLARGVPDTWSKDGRDISPGPRSTSSRIEGGGPVASSPLGLTHSRWASEWPRFAGCVGVRGAACPAAAWGGAGAGPAARAHALRACRWSSITCLYRCTCGDSARFSFGGFRVIFRLHSGGLNVRPIPDLVAFLIDPCALSAAQVRTSIWIPVGTAPPGRPSHWVDLFSADVPAAITATICGASSPASNISPPFWRRAPRSPPCAIDRLRSAALAAYHRRNASTCCKRPSNCPHHKLFVSCTMGHKPCRLARPCWACSALRAHGSGLPQSDELNQVTLAPAPLQSRFGRRLLLLFVGCAVLPIALVAAVSYGHITRELRSQSEARLHQANKAMGLALYERLLLLDATLKSISPRVLRQLQAVRTSPMRTGCSTPASTCSRASDSSRSSSRAMTARTSPSSARSSSRRRSRPRIRTTSVPASR